MSCLIREKQLIDQQGQPFIEPPGIDQRIQGISLERLSFSEMTGLKFIFKPVRILVETSLMMWNCLTAFFIALFWSNKGQSVSVSPSASLEPFEKKEDRKMTSGFNKIDLPVFETLIEGVYYESDLLEEEIKKLQLQDLKDLKNLNRLRYEVSENQKQADELLHWHEKMKIAGTPLFELNQVIVLKRVRSRFTHLNEMLEGKTKNEPSKYASLDRASLDLSEKSHVPAHSEGFFNLLFDWINTGTSSKIIEPLTKPPQFKNEYARCWMHAVLQLLFADDHFLEKGLLKHPDWELPKALSEMKKAIGTGLIWNTDNASRSFHRALIEPKRKNASAELMISPYSQKDAASLFETVLDDFEYKINLRRVLKGVGEQDHLSRVHNEKESILKISIKSNINTFQAAVDDHFSLQEIEDNQNVWLKDDISIPKRTESIQLVIEKEQDVPENLFVHLTRFVKVPEEELKHKLAEREFAVKKTVAQLRRKNPKFYDSDSVALVTANEKVPDVEYCMKDDNPLYFSHESNRFLIDFSKAFQAEAHTYVYELYGVIYQQGSLHHGHYTADVLRNNGKSSQWYHCDDIGRKIRSIKSSQVNPENGYFFAFKRIIF